MERWLIDLAQAGGGWIYLALFVSAFLENIVPPIPGDTVTLIGAYLVGRGGLNFWAVWFSTTLGSVAGFMSLFLMAYWLEERFLEKRLVRWVDQQKLARSQSWFRRYGYGVVLANRFLSGIRSVISISAGLVRLRPLPVLTLSTVSAAAWNFTLIYAGAYVGKSWEQIRTYIKFYNKLILIILAALAVFLLGWYLVRQMRVKNPPETIEKTGRD